MIAYDKGEVAVRGETLGEIWWQGRQWAVTAYGLERRDGTYFIAKEDLLHDALAYSPIEHIGKKIWADVDDLATAYLVAVALHGSRLIEPMRAVIVKGYRNATVSHEKGRLHDEMFPPQGKFEVINATELGRRCRVVDEEYQRRKDDAP